MRTQRAVQPVCCDSVLFQEHHSAQGMCIAPRCLVLSYISYVASLLLCYTFKNIYFNFIVYIYMYIYLLVFS